MNSLLQDLRYGIRMLMKNQGFTAVAVLTLALGIGANTAIFSVVDAVLLKPLAMQDPSRVVYIQEQWREELPGLSVGNFKDVHQQSRSFAKLAASNSASFNLSTSDMPQRVDGEYATAEYFETFGVPPLLGRPYSPTEDKPGAALVVVISERLWRTQFHADSAIVGRAVLIDGQPYTVVGVMPKTFDPLLTRSDIWMPSGFTPRQLADYDSHYLSVIGRLRPGVSPAQAQSELNVIADSLRQQHPLDDKDRSLRLTRLTTTLLGDQRIVLRLMLTAVGFLLLIACANIANLQLARAGSRQKEIAVRVALGASPQRIVRQLLIENVVLALISGVAGVFLAYWGGAWIVAHGPAEVPRLDQTHIDGYTLLFAGGVALLSSFLFGLVPALRSASGRVNEAFKEGAASVTASRDRVRSSLVVCEVALALLLMAGAGLLVRSALLVSHIDPGFDTSNLVVGRLGLPDAQYHDPTVARQTFERMITAAVALPNVQSAAVVSRAPLAGGNDTNGLLAEGLPLDPSNLVDARLQVVSPGYLSTARLRLLAGRDFTPQDTRDKKLVVVINQALARVMWAGQDPVGKRFACCEAGPKGRTDPVWHEVVGVVSNVRATGLDREVRPEFYMPLAQMPPAAWDWIGRTMDLVVRTKGDALPIRDLQTMVASIAPGVPIYRLSTMEKKIAGTLERSHFDAFLLAIFAATALLLSSVGIYGVLSYLVAQRTRDIGIRMALGATQRQILRHVIGYGALLTGIGLAAGIAAALVGTRVLSSLLYGIRPTDAVTFTIATLVLMLVALLASYLPARRATKVDPIVALRYE